MYALEMYKLNEVIDYVTLPPIAGSIMINIYLNLDAWDKFPDDLKKILNEVARELVPWVCNETAKLDKQYMAAAKKKGIKFITLPKEDAADLKTVAVKTWGVFAKKIPRCKELVSMLNAYLKGEIYRSIIPFTLLAFIGIAMVMLFPQLVLWLPSTMIAR